MLEARLTIVLPVRRNPSMALYELRTNTLQVGKMGELAKLYQEVGMPILTKRGYDKQLIGFFQADTGTINQIVFMLKFEDHEDLAIGLARSRPHVGDRYGA
jgi:hypothetical protein